MSEPRKISAFSTTDGTRFLVPVNYLTVKRVRELCGVNVLDILGPGDQLSGFLADDVQLLEVVCAVVRPQLKELNWSDDQFFSVVDGEVIRSATNCLMDEVTEFFPEPRKGLVAKVIAKVRAAAATLEARQVETVEAAISKADFELALRTHGNEGSTSPASSASSRGRSRSANSRGCREAASTKTGCTPHS